jgi:hypothetical protein
VTGWLLVIGAVTFAVAATILSSTFPLNETPKAIRYVGERSTQGKTVITV